MDSCLLSEGLGILEVRELILFLKNVAGQWWGMPLIPALRKQRHADLCEFKDSLVSKTNARTARTVRLLHRETLSLKTTQAYRKYLFVLYVYGCLVFICLYTTFMQCLQRS